MLKMKVRKFGRQYKRLSLTQQLERNWRVRWYCGAFGTPLHELHADSRATSRPAVDPVERDRRQHDPVLSVLHVRTR